VEQILDTGRSSTTGGKLLDQEPVVSLPPQSQAPHEGHTESQRLRIAKISQRLSVQVAAPARIRLVDFTDENFGDEVVESKVPVVIDFWAETCAPCRLMHPVVQRLAEHLGARAKVGRLNVFENPRTTEALEIKAIPYMMVVHRGDVVFELVGDRSFEDLYARLAPFIPS
jgi:thioredoxin 1